MKTYQFGFDGGILQRGFWLYVWEVQPPKGEKLYYVGRTGDSSSINAQSPFNRMGQHLGFAKNSSMLRRHLKEKRNQNPENCTFRLVAVGPILKEPTRGDLKRIHNERRDKISAMEKQLQIDMSASGYDVMNQVNSRKNLDVDLYARVFEDFAAEFPNLTKTT